MTDHPNGSRIVGALRALAWTVCCVVLALDIGSPPSARAESPVLQAWWTVNNLSLELPLPSDVLAPGAIPAVTIPSSDVPDGGSEVAGTTDSPTGALTLRYEFPEASTLGPLVLTLALDAPLAPGTELVACRLAGDGTFESQPGGGPIDDLPEHDCSDGVVGELDQEAGTFHFEDVTALAAPDHLSVAILPVAGRAVLERAAFDSLDVVRAEPPAPPAPVGAPPVTGAPAPVAAGGVTSARPGVAAPTFLGQTPTPTTTAPVEFGEVAAPTTPVEPVAERFVSVLRGVRGGDAAGSALAGAGLVFLAASSVWRRNRVALLEVVASTEAR